MTTVFEYFKGKICENGNLFFGIVILSIKWLDPIILCGKVIH